MHTPTIDIVVPVWNSPFETRACLAAILEHTPGARLIIVDNGSSRETELMLEEFSESLAENGLFIKSERNVGLVPALNMGLARSDSDLVAIVRPHVQIGPGWLAPLMEAAQHPLTGIVTPRFAGAGAPQQPKMSHGCTLMETCDLAFAAMLLKNEMRMLVGGFDEAMDGGEWCLRDYVQRTHACGYRVSVSARSQLVCGSETLYGSPERRQEMEQGSRSIFRERWGVQRHYAVYFGAAQDAGALVDTVEATVEAARRGHRFTLYLHRKQFREFCRRGWNGLHTNIELVKLALLRSERDLIGKMAVLQSAEPALVAVRGTDGAPFPGVVTTLPFAEIARAVAIPLTTPKEAV